MGYFFGAANGGNSTILGILFEMSVDRPLDLGRVREKNLGRVRVTAEMNMCIYNATQIGSLKHWTEKVSGSLVSSHVCLRKT